MRTRLLLTPDADGSGGGTAPVAAATTTTTTPAAAAPAGITITAEEYRKLLEAERRATDLEAEKQREVEAERQKAVDALAAKGQTEEALRKEREDSATKLNAERARSTQLENERLADKKSEALSAALLGADFLNDVTATQVRMILGDRFEAVRDATGSVVVREKGTLKPVGEVVKAFLGSTEGAHFLKPTSRGGSGAKGADQPPPAAAEIDRTLRADEQLVQHLKGKAAAAPRHYGLAKRAPAK